LEKHWLAVNEAQSLQECAVEWILASCSMSVKRRLALRDCGCCAPVTLSAVFCRELYAGCCHCARRRASCYESLLKLLFVVNTCYQSFSCGNSAGITRARSVLFCYVHACLLFLTSPMPSILLQLDMPIWVFLKSNLISIYIRHVHTLTQNVSYILVFCCCTVIVV